MVASDIITALTTGNPCPAWVQQAALLMDPSRFNQTYSTTAVNFFTETTVRVPTVKVAKRSGQEYEGLQRRRMDLVALVQPHYKAYNTFAVGVEIKVSEHDLLNDQKLTDYLPYTHLFYLATPHHLKDQALTAIGNIKYSGVVADPLSLVGLLLVDDQGRVTVHHHPVPGQPTEQCLRELYSEMLIRLFKLAGKECKCFINFERRPNP